jgi:hypothetical protein
VSEAIERPEHDDELCPTREVPCFKCHLRGVTIGMPSDFRSRSTYLKAAPRKPGMSYEKGVPVSHRPDGTVMPYLRSDGDPMHQKEFDSKRHLIRENMERLNAASSTT